MDAERLLSEYRTKKSKKDLGKYILPSLSNSERIKDDESEKLVSPASSTDDLSENFDDLPNDGLSKLDYLFYCCCFLFWVTLYAIFIQLQFGMVYLILSCLIGIYLNTRTRPKKQGEVSAYSVFNKDCKSIDGTLKAEQFEREIRYGGTAVR